MVERRSLSATGSAETFRQGRRLVELTLPVDSPVVGTRVGDVVWPPDTALVTLLREGRVIVPSQDDPLESGDELLFVATADVEGQLEDMLSPHHHPHHERED